MALQLFLLSLVLLRISAQPGPQGPPPTPYAEPNPKVRLIPKPLDKLFRDVSIGHCRCSPTTRGHPPLDAPEARRFIERLQVVSKTPYTDLLRASYERLAAYAARALVNAWSFEGMVNLDASLRGQGSIVFCVYDNATGENFGLDFYRPVEAEVSLLACDKIPKLRASDKLLAKFVNATIVPTAIPVPDEL